MKFLRNDGETIKVKTIVLDNYCREKKINPTFIKIDAEGAESLILDGTIYIMSDLRPLISIEVGGEDEWEENCQKSIKTLLNNGYSVYECTVKGKLEKHIQQKKYSYDNLIFIPKEKESAIINVL